MTHRHIPSEAFNFGVNALAVYRLTRLISEDVILDRPRDWIAQNAPDKVAYLVTCPHCLSIYLGAVAVFAGKVAPRVWNPVATALALSAATSLKTEFFETFDPSA